MKKRLIMMTALAFCLGALPAAAGAKTTVQASEYDNSYDNEYDNSYDNSYDNWYDGDDWGNDNSETLTPDEKSVYEYTSYVLEDQSVAKGKTRTLSIEDEAETDWYGEAVTPENVSWSVEGSAVKITSGETTGKTLEIKALAEGEATVSVTYDMEYSSVIYRYTSTATIYVSNPKLVSKKIGINKHSTTYGSLEITGCNEYSTVTCTPSSSKVTAYTYYDWWSSSESGSTMKLVVNASKKGTYTIALDIDGKSFTVNVNVSAYFKRIKAHSVDTVMDKKWYEGSTMLALYKGATDTLTVKGLDAGTKIKWKSSNKKVATVNQNGVVRGKGNGSCTITASFSDGSITYEVGVAPTVATKAVYYAIKHFGSTYSQAERMAEGKYDCSSYVYRAYKAAGKTLGTSTTYAPTAADLAKWCAEKGYVLYDETETVDVSKLRPGDLIFETGENNGRYKGIYHVDIYAGNGGTLTVERTKYWGDTITGVIVARPCK
jgi:cell wall-associated NlpC family hydrolase